MEMSKQDTANENENVLREIFRDRVYNGIHQGTTWQFHRYGINCKLSGSVYAVSEIEGAIPLIHGPAGCAFHQRLTPRKMYAPIYNLPCTDLDENDVIYGGEDKLRDKINEVYHRFHPPLIAVLPTCISGLVGDDVSGVITELDLPCDLLHVPSEGFAHRSRESLDMMMRDYAESWKDPSRSPAYDLRGCGHEEVMFSIVDQLMEEQEIAPNLVNIESFGRFTYGFRSELAEIKHIFGEMGVSVNLTLPTCTVEEIKRAPAAELNIVTRNLRWAERMKERFGNDYLRKWFFYFGFDGVEKFYHDCASKLGLDGEADASIRKEKTQSLQELE
ncbi:MAG: nitrogenase component 1, partial [Methanosarcinales archaeon]|nr:nitrogenase component 1 [Methanosarcinales archaeon]